MMIDQKSITLVAERIGRAAGARKVILFGSLARGEAGSTSDVDFLVISETSLPRHKRSRQLYAMFEDYPFPMDIIVYTPQEVDEGVHTPGSFLASAIAQGREVYVG